MIEPKPVKCKKQKAIHSLRGVKGAFLEEVAFALEDCKSLQVGKEAYFRRARLAGRRVRCGNRE